jgi:hypothetical protein
MQERFVASSEAAAIVLKGLRRHRRIAEAWVAFDVRCSPFVNITPCGGESVVKPLPRYLSKVGRRRRLNVGRLRMGTSSQRQRQQQGC